MTTQEIENLIEAMKVIAEAAVSDHEYRHSDYAGDSMFKAKEEARKILTEGI